MRFYNAAGLVNELLAAQEAHRVPQLLATALKQQVIILDELGFIPFSERGAQLIFQFCSALHERVALIVTTNLRFADWTQVFGNPSLTAALLDRLTARAHILEFVGDSYRLRQQPAPLPSEPSLAELVAAIWDEAEHPGPEVGATAPTSGPGEGGPSHPRPGLPPTCLANSGGPRFRDQMAPVSVITPSRDQQQMAPVSAIRWLPILM